MPRPPLQLSVTAGALELPVRDVPRRARELGLSGVQLEARSRSIDLTTLSATGRRELLHLFSSRDQSLAGLVTSAGNQGIDASGVVDQELEMLDQAMEAARGLGSSLLCLDLGPLPEPPPEKHVAPPAISEEMAGLIIIPKATQQPESKTAAMTPPALNDPRSEAIKAIMQEVGRLADRYGVVLALRSDLSSMAALEKVLKDADCPWFGVDLNPAAMLDDAWSLDETLSRVGRLIRHVRGRDAVAGADLRSRPAAVGRGQVRWPQLLSQLEAADYRGWLTIDPAQLRDRPAAVAQAVALLKPLL